MTKRFTLCTLLRPIRLRRFLKHVSTKDHVIGNVTLAMTLNQRGVCLPVTRLALYRLRRLRNTIIRPNKMFRPLNATLRSPPMISHPTTKNTIPYPNRRKTSSLNRRRIPPPLQRTRQLRGTIKRATTRTMVTMNPFQLPRILAMRSFSIFPIQRVLQIYHVTRTNPTRRRPTIKPSNARTLDGNVSNHERAVRQIYDRVTRLITIKSSTHRRSRRVNRLVNTKMMNTRRQVKHARKAIRGTNLKILNHSLRTNNIRPNTNNRSSIHIIINRLFRRLLYIRLKISVLPTTSVRLVQRDFRRHNATLILSTRPYTNLNIILIRRRRPRLTKTKTRGIRLTRRQLQTLLQLRRRFRDIKLYRGFRLIPRTNRVLPRLNQNKLTNINVAMRQRMRRGYITQHRTR